MVAKKKRLGENRRVERRVASAISGIKGGKHVGGETGGKVAQRKKDRCRCTFEGVNEAGRS